MIAVTGFVAEGEDASTITCDGAASTTRLVELSHVPRRVIQIDFETNEVLVVSDADYSARDFSRAERVPIREALWLPL